MAAYHRASPEVSAACLYDARRTSNQHGIEYTLNSGYAGSEYATLFYAMCDLAGVKCERLTGRIKKSSIGLSGVKMSPVNSAHLTSDIYHAWNRVKIGGKWYYADSAANDTGSGSSGKYLLSTKQWSDHTGGSYDCVFESYKSHF